jgi:hypothetical protein
MVIPGTTLFLVQWQPQLLGDMERGIAQQEVQVAPGAALVVMVTLLVLALPGRVTLEVGLLEH